jgi:molecular chaperone Hsp33
LMHTADGLVKTMAAGQTVRALAAVTTQLVDEARRRHTTAPTASAALGRTMTAGLLLGSLLRDDETISLQFVSKGHLRGILVDANAQGEVRGFVYHPRTHLPARNGKLDVGGAVGSGIFVIMRSQPWSKTPYRSVLPIVSGEIGQDIAHYLLHSEQIPSAVSLGVFVQPDESVQAAGGFVIQAMPGATDELIAQLENRVARTRPVSDLIRNGATPHEIIQEVVGEFAPSVVGEQDVQFVCRCSQERVLGALVALGLDEIQDLLATKGQADVTCEFCNRQFIIDRASLEQLIVENGAE